MQNPVKMFREFLEERNLPFSPGPEAICRAVFDLHSHFTIESLAEKLPGTQTPEEIHEILEQMISAGLIRKFMLDRERVYYEHIYGHVHHDHLVCVSCGKIVEFQSPGIERLQNEMARRNDFVLLRHTLRIEGLCAKCRAKESAGKLPAVWDEGLLPDGIPLTMIENGSRVWIMSLRCEEGPSHHLLAMGFKEGQEIEVLQNNFSGPLTIRHNNTRLALGNDLAHQIFVTRKNPAAAPPLGRFRPGFPRGRGPRRGPKGRR